MKVTGTFLIPLCLIVSSCFGQSGRPFEISRPELSFAENKVKLNYELLGSSTLDTFSIRLLVSDARGGSITARALSGDVGPEVPGGGVKTILWNLGQDSLLLDEEVFFEVFALHRPPPPAPDIPVEKSSVSQEQVAEETEVETPVNANELEAGSGVPEAGSGVPEAGSGVPEAGSGVPEAGSDEQETGSNEQEAGSDLPVMKSTAGSTAERSFRRSTLLMQSALLPGLGLSRIHEGKPHWIKGVAGYGCIAASIYLNSQARSTFEEYKNADEVDRVDLLFRQSARQDALSEILAYGAIGIWATDLLWTYLGSRQFIPAGSGRGFTIGTSLDDRGGTWLLSVRYRF